MRRGHTEDTGKRPAVFYTYINRSKGLEIDGKAVCEECSRRDYFIPIHLPSFIRRPPRDIGIPVFFAFVDFVSRFRQV